MKNIAKHPGMLNLLVGAILALAGPALAITPTPGTLPPVTPTTVDNSAGNQTDPHVSGDLVSYTADTGAATQIRYFNFATGTDSGISPTTGATDFLSDVSGSRIVFTRVSSGKSAIHLFDVATGNLSELDPVAGSNRQAAAIGGDTVAWVDRGPAPNGEILAHDLVTGTSVQLTNDTFIDRRPAVSPNGNVVVWEKCAITGNCGIYKALRIGGFWMVSAVTSTSDPHALADTNGILIVYGSARATSVAGADIYWTDLVTGIEHQLELDGTQSNPNISGNLIAFESQPPNQSFPDLFVYDLATNTLYQLTNTPNLSEELNDISVSPSGLVRVVWARLETDYNVYALTFELESCSIERIVEIVGSLVSLTPRQKQTLTAVLQAALAKANQGDKIAAIKYLEWFINAVNNLMVRGKLSSEQGAALIEAAECAIALLMT